MPPVPDTGLPPVEPARASDLDCLAGMHLRPSARHWSEAARAEPARHRYYRDKVRLFWALEPAGVFLVRSGADVAGFMLATCDAATFRRRLLRDERAWTMFVKFLAGIYGYRGEMAERFAVLAAQGLGVLRVRLSGAGGAPAAEDVPASPSVGASPAGGVPPSPSGGPSPAGGATRSSSGGSSPAGEAPRSSSGGSAVLPVAPPFPPARQRGYIFGGIVAEEHRGRGILKALHLHAGDYARACGADRMSANILPGNAPALAAARWVGFIVQGRMREIPGETLYVERRLDLEPARRD